MTKVFAENIDEAQIEAWKKEYGSVFEIAIDDTDEVAAADYEKLVSDLIAQAVQLKKIEESQKENWQQLATDNLPAVVVILGFSPSDYMASNPKKSIVGYFKKPSNTEIGLISAVKNEFEGAMIMYNSCLLGGHPSFEKDDDVKRAAFNQFPALLKTRVSSLKKH